MEMRLILDQKIYPKSAAIIVHIVIVFYNGSARSTRFEFWAVALAVEAAAALLRNAVSLTASLSHFFLNLGIDLGASMQ